MFGKLGDLANLMKQAGAMQARAAEIRDELKAEIVQGSAGGGMVQVEADGSGELRGVQIDPDVFAEGDREFIEGLLVHAVNDALEKGRNLHREKIESLTGGLSLPGMDKMMDQFFGR
jgi:DNA-binding YbaB/EbfC family protein